MRILMCPEYFYPHIGGGEVWAWNVARYLVRMGHDVIVLTYKHPGYLSDEVKDGVNIQRLGFLPIKGIQPYLIRSIIQGFGILRRGLRLDYDIILASQTFPLIPSYLVAKLRRKPIVAVFHDIYGFRFSLKDKGLIKGLIRGFVEYVALKLHYDAIITVSRSTMSKLLRYSIPKDKIYVVYGGVDIDFIESLHEDKSDKPMIIYVGRLVKHKKVDILITIFKKILEKIENAELYIVGRGLQERDLKELAKKLKVIDRIFFKGYVSEEDKIKLLKKAHVFVLPSIKEGFGLVLAEALACGTPVVAIDSGGVREVIRDGATGYLIDFYDIRGLYDKIVDLLTNEEKAFKMGIEGKRIIKNKFTWSRVAEKVEYILHKVRKQYNLEFFNKNHNIKR